MCFGLLSTETRRSDFSKRGLGFRGWSYWFRVSGLGFRRFGNTLRIRFAVEAFSRAKQLAELCFL